MARGAELSRDELVRTFGAIRTATLPAALAWLALGVIFDTARMYAQALTVAAVTLSAEVFRRRIRAGRGHPGQGVLVTALCICVSSISGTLLAPWAAGGIVCAIVFSGLFILTFGSRAHAGWVVPLIVALASACVAVGVLVPASDRIAPWARGLVNVAVGVVTTAMIFFAQLASLRRERAARASLERSNAELAGRERELLRLGRTPELEEGDFLMACRLVTGAAQSGLGVPRASVWRLDAAQQALVLVLLRDGEQTSTEPTSLPYALYPRYVAALNESRTLLAHAARQDPRTAEFTDTYLVPLDIHSMLDAGIRFAGQTVGVLCCEQTNAPRHWSEPESFFVGALTDALSRALAAAEKRRADSALHQLNADLERRVAARTAEAELARVRLGTIFDTLPGVVYEFAYTPPWGLSITFASSVCRKIYGFTPEAAYADNTLLMAAIVPEDRPQVMADLEGAMVRGRDYLSTYRVRHAGDDTVRWLRSNAQSVVRQGATTIFRGYVTDITELKLLEDAADAARRAAEDATRAKSQFLANMSHEIRTPMNAIVGLSYLALKTALSPRQQDYVDKIHGAAQSLTAIINDILDLSKIEAGKLALESIDFSLPEVLDTLVGLVGLRAQDKGLEFRVTLGDDVPRVLTGDPLRLGQVLLNLASNAVKFTSQGRVLVGVAVETPASPPASRPTAMAAATVLRFTVTDTGIGLAPAEAEGMFEAFRQADASTTRRYGGTGLGLAISRQLAELMGGEIGVESTAGEGSTFWFTVPLGVVPERRGVSVAMGLPDRRLKPGADGAAALAGLTVLLVEDNDINQQIAREILAGFGATVDIASDGCEALARLRAEPKRYELILMDMQMPGMDGPSAAAAMRADPHLPRLPIIAMTANAMETDRQRCLAAGMDDFISKPFHPEQLRRLLKRWRTVGAGAAPEPASDPGVTTRPLLACHRRDALARLGSEDRWRTLSRQLLAQAHRELATLAGASAEQDPAGGASIAHSLAGAAGLLGFERLAEAARQLERALKTGAAPDQALVATLDALAEAEGAFAATATAAAPPPDDVLAGPPVGVVLDTLQVQIDACDTRAGRTWRQLRDSLGALPAACLAPLDDHLQAFDFEAARASLQQLRRALDE